MQTQDQIIQDRINSKRLGSLLNSAGIKYWKFSLSPAIVGLTLPFWLNKGFSFNSLNALEFVFAVVFFHAGFCLLQRGSDTLNQTGWSKKQLMVFGSLSLMLSIVLAVHLNTNIQLNMGVYPYLFPALVAASFFLGFLLVVPPMRLIQHALGAYIFIVAMGMMPVMGGYLVQMGDLHRTVYLASFPLIFATGLWVWLSKLRTRSEDERKGNTTLVTLFPKRFAGKYLTFFITTGIYFSLILAIVGRSSLNPLSMVSFLSVGLAYQVIVICWNDFDNEKRLIMARKKVSQVYLIISASIVLSSIAVLLE